MNQHVTDRRTLLVIGTDYLGHTIVSSVKSCTVQDYVNIGGCGLTISSLIATAIYVTINAIAIEVYIYCMNFTLFRTAIYVTIYIGRSCVGITTLGTYVQRDQTCNTGS